MKEAPLGAKNFESYTLFLNIASICHRLLAYSLYDFNFFLHQAIYLLYALFHELSEVFLCETKNLLIVSH